MKFNIKYFIAIVFLCILSHYNFAQTIVGKKGITSNGKSANLGELAKSEPTELKTKKAKLPPEENEDEETLEKLTNEVLDFAPMQKVQVSGLPASNFNREITEVQAPPCINFQGVNINTSSPPDPHGGVGFESVMGTTNNTIRIQNKLGVQISNVQLGTFFSPLGAAFTADIFDPRINYDPYSHKWIFVCAGRRESAGSCFLLAISQTPDPNGGWWQWAIDADGANVNWLDYPQIGVNKNWITISANMFQIGTAGAFYSRVFVLDKTPAYSGNSFSYNFFDFANYGNMAPSINYDAAQNNMWVVSNFSSNSGGNGFLKLFTIAGSGASPTMTINNTIQVGSAWANGGVGGPQSGTTTQIDLGDHRIQNVCYRNGVLWSTQSVSFPATAPTYTGIQAVAINPSGGGSHIETQRITDATGSAMAAFPSIIVNKDNDVALSYITSYPNAFPSCAVSFRRGAGAFEGYVFKAGEDWYSSFFGSPTPRNRFGDYTSVFVDPEDDKTMWAFSEYSRSDGPSAGTSSWGTWWAKICPDFCSNDLTLNASNGNNFLKKYEVNNTIISSSLIYPGANIKYDAGTKVTLSPGFKAFQGSKVNVYIEGCGGVR